MKQVQLSEITATVETINRLDAELASARNKLHDLTKAWADQYAGATTQTAPVGRAAKKGFKVKPRTVNVSATVLALVAKTPGLTAPQIMDKLGLREHEAAVRSALKKSKRVVVSDKKWFPLPEAPKEKAPEVQGLSDYIPHAGE